MCLPLSCRNHQVPESLAGAAFQRHRFCFHRRNAFFCDRDRKRHGIRTEALVKCLTEQSELLIKECAEAKQDHTLLGKIDGVDLRAREAKYHESCRREYVRRVERPHHAQVEDAECASLAKAAHNDAFDTVCQYIDTKLVQGTKVVRVSMLKGMYVCHMANNHPDFHNPNYCSDKLKKKLMSHLATSSCSGYRNLHAKANWCFLQHLI